jgi:hypothetical protein
MISYADQQIEITRQLNEQLVHFRHRLRAPDGYQEFIDAMARWLVWMESEHAGRFVVFEQCGNQRYEEWHKITNAANRLTDSDGVGSHCGD